MRVDASGVRGNHIGIVGLNLGAQVGRLERVVTDADPWRPVVPALVGHVWGTKRPIAVAAG
jgi:hypothetical protein